MSEYIVLPGHTMPTIGMRVKDNELVIGRITFEDRYIGDADSAIELLMRGEAIHLQQHGPLCSEVQQRMSAMLRGRVAA